jgi:uncharacterized protein involved in exopolysaccharide biosynthesis
MAKKEMDRVVIAEPGANAIWALEEEKSSFDLVGLLQTLYRGRWTILVASLATLLIATVYAFLLPFEYTSTVAFIPPTINNSSLSSLVAGQLSSFGVGDLIGGLKNSGDMYLGLLASRSILGEVVKRCDLMQEYRVNRESMAEKILERNTTAAVDSRSSIVTLNVTDKSPGRAHDLANAYLDALRDTEGRLALTQSSQRRLFFGEQLAKEKDDLEDAEVELKKTEEQSGLIAPTGQTEAEITTIAETQAQIAVREVQLAALRQSATEQNPEMIRLRSEIDDLQGQLLRLQKGGGDRSVAAIPTAKVPELQLEYVRKDREVKYHEALFDMLSRQYEAARLDEARDAPVLQVLDPASYPDMKSAPKRLYYMLGGLLFGLMASCFWVMVRDRLRALRAAFAARETD